MASRRGRVGVGRSRGAGPKFNKKAEEIKADSLASAMDTVKKLEIKLSDFAKKHRKDIQNDPAFRKTFLDMCGPLGVDPLSSKKGFWGGVIGIGEFYYELAVKVAEVCLASRSQNGGLLTVSEIHQTLNKRGTKFRFSDSQESGSSRYSQEDIITAIGKLSKLGSGFRTVKIGKTVMVISVPTELDNDHMEVIKIAQDESGNVGSGRMRGEVTADDVKKSTGWNKDRVQRALDLLLTKGMIWIDENPNNVEGPSYWLPSVWKESLAGNDVDIF